MKRSYLLFKRGHLWYYRLAGEKTFHTTRLRNRNKAEAFVVELLASSKGRNRNQRQLSFRRYTEPFFDWEHCPHIYVSQGMMTSHSVQWKHHTSFPILYSLKPI